MRLVGLANTRLSTGYDAQKSPRSLFDNCCKLSSFLLAHMVNRTMYTGRSWYVCYILGSLHARAKDRAVTRELIEGP